MAGRASRPLALAAFLGQQDVNGLEAGQGFHAGDPVAHAGVVGQIGEAGQAKVSAAPIMSAAPLSVAPARHATIVPAIDLKHRVRIAMISQLHNSRLLESSNNMTAM